MRWQAGNHNIGWVIPIRCFFCLEKQSVQAQDLIALEVQIVVELPVARVDHQLNWAEDLLEQGFRGLVFYGEQIQCIAHYLGHIIQVLFQTI